MPQMRQLSDIVPLGCRDGARRGAGHGTEGFATVGAMTRGQVSLRPDSGEGALVEK